MENANILFRSGALTSLDIYSIKLRSSRGCYVAATAATARSRRANPTVARLDFRV